MKQRMHEAERYNAPLIISEFGACYDTDACIREITQVMDHCEENICAGWAYNQFKEFDETAISVNHQYDMKGLFDSLGNP